MPKLTLRQALSMGIMACNYVADENPDLSEWAMAACLLRELLVELRGPVPPWFMAYGLRGGPSNRGGKYRDEYNR